MTACIYYHPEAYTTSGPKLMGRNAAGESFLKGFITHSNLNEFWVQTDKKDFAEHFARTVRGLGRSETVKWVESKNLQTLSEPGVAFYPGPGLTDHAWQRSLFGHEQWSLCGITHTTSSATAMDAITGMLAGPLQPWDALICTSTAVKQNVQNLLQAQAEFFKDRLGATRFVLPQLPVIPLGIHSQDFVFGPEQRSQARASLQIDSETIVVLFMGRLSFHAKAHPLAMYQALQTATQHTGKKTVLIECGWHANQHLADAFNAASQLACPDVRVITLDGRIPEDRQKAWAAAEIFCSLSDNIQETFGIVPIEAMAAGLPVIVTDWDGYKDTVRHGVDGFRVPTIMPQAGYGADLAMRHALGLDTYDVYLGNTCSLVGVDIEATTDAFIQLMNSSVLRKEMGEAGRRRARDVFDWQVIIPDYEGLWSELNQIRTREAPLISALRTPWPARMDPFTAFQGYGTSSLTPETKVMLVDATLEQAKDRLKNLQSLTMANFAQQIVPSDKLVSDVLVQLSAGPQPINTLALAVNQSSISFVRSFSWMIKLGILRIHD